MLPLNEKPTLEDIILTHEAIQPFIHRTPVLTCTSLNELVGAELFFKCENFQKVGAFKMRGAISAALRLSRAEQEKGLCTHSSGNHAQAVALSAKLLKVPAYIVMPENAPKIKMAATKGYGAEITFCAPTIEARENTLREVVEKTGATFIHPYNNYNVIAGQATAAKELMETVAGLEVMMAPIGGGGLFSGTALVSKYMAPGIQVIGAEPKAVDDAYRSFHMGSIQENETINTIADGLRTNLGPKTFEIIRHYADDILTVTEQAIIDAMKLIWQRMKIVIEPSCAVPFAAICSMPEKFKGKKVGIILTGGNVDLEALPF